MDIMQALAQAAGNHEDDESELAPIQVIERLRSVHEHLQAFEAFEPGDILAHKFPDLADTKGARDPRMFVRYLREPVRPAEHPEAFEDASDWGSNITAREFDCVIGVIRGDTYAEFLDESCKYRKATKADFNGHATDT